jgi:hypothetical protein
MFGENIIENSVRLCQPHNFMRFGEAVENLKIPLPFREALSGLLQVKPEAKKKSKANSNQATKKRNLKGRCGIVHVAPMADTGLAFLHPKGRPVMPRKIVAEWLKGR